MKNNLQLVELSNIVSNDFITKNANMNETLEKLAEQHSLSKDEIHRVAETANVNVYLKLIEQSDEKYIHFPLADYNLVYENLTQKVASYKNKTNDSLYEDIKDSREFSFSMYKQKSNPDIQKLASFVPRNPINDKLIEADKYKTCIKYIENVIIDNKGEIRNLIDKGYNLVKQAFLNGTSFKDLERIVKETSPSLSDEIIEIYKNQLSESSITFDLEKTAQYNDYKINPDSKLVNVLKTIEEKFLFLEKVAEHYQHFINEYNQLVKKYKIGFEKNAGKVWDWIKKHPKTVTALAVGIPTYNLGKLKGYYDSKNQPLTKEQIYQKLQEPK